MSTYRQHYKTVHPKVWTPLSILVLLLCFVVAPSLAYLL